MCGCGAIGESIQKIAEEKGPSQACCATIIVAILIIMALGLALKFIGVVTSSIVLSLAAIGLLLCSFSALKEGKC